MSGSAKQFYYDTSLGREFAEFWESIWSQAKAALRGCEKVVVCGYSLPAADDRARKLLFENVQRTAHVEIVSGSDSERIANEFRELAFTRAAPSQGKYFSDWVGAVIDEPSIQDLSS